MFTSLSSLSPIRGGVSVLSRVAGTLALTVLTAVYAVSLGMVCVEMSGAAWKPPFSLGDRDETRTHSESKESRVAGQLPLGNPLSGGQGFVTVNGMRSVSSLAIATVAAITFSISPATAQPV